MLARQLRLKDGTPRRLLRLGAAASFVLVAAAVAPHSAGAHSSRATTYPPSFHASLGASEIDCDYSLPNPPSIPVGLFCNRYRGNTQEAAVTIFGSRVHVGICCGATGNGVGDLVAGGEDWTVRPFKCTVSGASTTCTQTQTGAGFTMTDTAIEPFLHPPVKSIDPCQSRYPSGTEKTVGSQKVFDRQASLNQVCEGFGAPDTTGFKLTPSMQCAIIAAAATYGGPVVNAGVSKGCDLNDIAVAYQTGTWLGAVKSIGCGYFSDIFAGGVGIFAAGATSETGPGAVAVGVGTYKALAAGLKLVCGGIFGIATQLGQTLEGHHETAVALDVIRRGKCIAEKHTHLGISWNAVTCSPSGGQPATNLPGLWGARGFQIRPAAITVSCADEGQYRVTWDSYSATRAVGHGIATPCRGPIKTVTIVASDVIKNEFTRLTVQVSGDNPRTLILAKGLSISWEREDWVHNSDSGLHPWP